MGFFDKKELLCVICVGKVKIFSLFEIADGLLCGDCGKKCGYTLATITKKKTLSDVKIDMESNLANKQLLENFNPTRTIGTYLEIDEEKKQWIVPNNKGGKKKKDLNVKVYQFSDIVSFELLENGETITKGGLGAAIAGDLLFGGIGAVVGGITGKKKSQAVCNNMQIKITVKNISKPTVYLNFFDAPLKKDGFIYKGYYKVAQEVLSLLQLMCESEQKPTETNQIPQLSEADEILKFKNLLDSGIITQDEFEAKKKQLLGI
jgi:hypothetical protein